MSEKSNCQGKPQTPTLQDNNANERYASPSVVEESRLTAVTGSVKTTGAG